MRLVLRKVVLSKFLNYPAKPETFEFVDGITGILGENGAGKSSVLDAVTFVLFGYDSKALRNKLLSSGGYVEVTFESDASTVSFKKEMVAGSLKRYFRLGEGNWEMLMDKEFAEKVGDYIGLDYKGFTYASFVEQDKLQDLGNATPAAKLDILKDLFNFRKFDKCYKETLAVLSDNETQSSVLKEAKAFYAKRLAEMEQMHVTGTLSELESEASALDVSLREFITAKDNAAEDVLRLRPRVDSYHSATGAIRQLRDELRATSLELANSTSAVEERARVLAEVEAMKRRLTSATSQQGQAREIDTKIQSLNEKRDIVARLQAQVDEADRKIQQVKSDAASRLVGLSRKKEGLEATVRQVSDGGVLPFNQGKQLAVSLGKHLGVVSRLQFELDSIDLPDNFKVGARKILKSREASIASAETSLQRFVPDSASLQSKIDQIAEVEAEMSREKDEAGRRNAKIEEGVSGSRVQLNDLLPTSELQMQLTQLADARNSINNLERNIDKKQILLREVEGRMQKVSVLEERVKEVQAQIDRQSADVNVLSPVVSDHDRAQREVTRLANAITSTTQKLEASRANIKIMKMSDTGKINAEIRQREDEIARLDKERIVHEELKLIFQKKLVTYILSNILPQIGVYASNHATVLSDSRITGITLDRTKSGVDILVRSEDAEKAVESLSGGEKVVVNLALRFGICQVLAAMTDIQVQTIFLDEADLGSLDQGKGNSALKRFMTQLDQIGQFFKNIVIISHLPISDFFSQKYRVYRDEEGHSRARAM